MAHKVSLYKVTHLLSSLCICSFTQAAILWDTPVRNTGKNPRTSWKTCVQHSLLTPGGSKSSRPRLRLCALARQLRGLTPVNTYKYFMTHLGGCSRSEVNRGGLQPKYNSSIRFDFSCCSMWWVILRCCGHIICSNITHVQISSVFTRCYMRLFWKNRERTAL